MIIFVHTYISIYKGLQISPSRVSKKTGKSIRYMNCSYKYITKGLGCSGTGSRIYADELENYVLKQIKGKLAEFEGLNEQNATQTNPKLNENKIRLAQIDKEIDDLVEKVSGANSVLMRYINERVEQLDAERRALSEENLYETTIFNSTNEYNICFEIVENGEKIKLEYDTDFRYVKVNNSYYDANDFNNAVLLQSTYIYDKNQPITIVEALSNFSKIDIDNINAFKKQQDFSKK